MENAFEDTGEERFDTKYTRITGFVFLLVICLLCVAIYFILDAQTANGLPAAINYRFVNLMRWMHVAGY